jgi:hypothetical protein
MAWLIKEFLRRSPKSYGICLPSRNNEIAIFSRRTKPMLDKGIKNVFILHFIHILDIKDIKNP